MLIEGKDAEMARMKKDRNVAVRWANQSVGLLQDAFFPVADALRGLETYVRDTPHHNAPEAAAARKALAKFDAARESFDADLADRLCASPAIEALTPSNDQWMRCESIQDTYDLMKRCVRSALLIATPPASSNDEGLVEALHDALHNLLAEKQPAYHDCIDNGEAECVWCAGQAALARHREGRGGE